MFGLNINIETKLGHYRQKPNKEPHIMPADYGDIVGTRGNDGDPIDVFVGLFKNSKQIFIANKYNKDGIFDEHKVLLGFFDREQAVNVYKTAYSWHKIDDSDIVELTESQFLFWLKYANKNAPIVLENLPFDPLNKDITMTNITATYDWANEQKAAAQIVYDMRQTDQDEQLLEQMEISALTAELAENGEILSGAEDAAFDALVIQNKALPRKVNLIGKALNAAGSSLSVVENGVQISKPYRSNGVTQVAAVFELSDGQTVSIMLHNQDATPSKLTPEDNLIAWRWLLNKKDITIVVTKENGRDQNIRLIARKVMVLAEKNADRFAKANLRRQERKEALQKEQSEIEALELELKQLIEERDSLKEQIKLKRETGGTPESAAANNDQPANQSETGNGEPENGEPAEPTNAENGQPVEPENGEPENNAPENGEPESGQPENGEPDNGSQSSDNQDDDDADTKLLKRVANGETTPEELGDIDFLQSALDVAKNHSNEELKLAALNALREPMKQLLIAKLAATQ